MTTLTPSDLSRRVRALLDDTGGLHTAAGLGVAATPGALALGGDEQGQAWHVVDLRAVDGDAARTALGAALAQAKPLVVMVGADAPRSALRLARAFADRRHGGASQVDLGDHNTRVLPVGQSMVVVVEGVVSHDALPDDLKRIDFWEFVA